MGEALEQDSERYAPSQGRAILDAQLGHIMPCLQVCQQHACTAKVNMHQSGRRRLSTSADCPRQRLHSDFDNALWNAENEKRSDETEVEIQAAW